MQLTDKQIQLLIDFAVYFTFTVGAITIIREIYRLIRNIFKKIYQGIRRMRIRRQVKNHNGHKNFKDNTWYADGTIYHPDTKEFEKADYNNLRCEIREKQLNKEIHGNLHIRKSIPR